MTANHELPKSAGYWVPWALALAAGIGLAAFWAMRDLPAWARVGAVSAFVVLAAVSFRPDALEPEAIEQHRYAETLAVWVAPDTECVRPVLADGTELHREPLATRYTKPHRPFRTRWFGAGVLKLAPLEDARGRRETPSGVLPFPAPLAEVVRTAAQAMLDLTGGNKSEAARRLGISRPRLQRLLDGNLEE